MERSLRLVGSSWQGVLAWSALASTLAAQAGTVQSEQKISETSGGFGSVLNPDDRFGYSVASLGDLDGDGTGDLAVGAPLDDDGAHQQGAVWILFLDADGTVSSEQKISETTGGLDGGDWFGLSVSSPLPSPSRSPGRLTVGAPFDDDGSLDQGAIWILVLNPDGTVASEQKISETTGGFGGVLDPGDQFGHSTSYLADLDGNGTGDLAVGSPYDDDGRIDQGAVWILFLNADGTVASERKISETTGGFEGRLDPSDWFGYSVTFLGDLDGNGTGDLAVGAPGDDDGGFGGSDTGAVWILFLNADGTVASEQKISKTTGGFGGPLNANDGFGLSVASLGDGNGTGGLAVGAALDDDGGLDAGAVWILSLNADGTVASEQKISETTGGFGGALDPIDLFGLAVSSPGDLDRDGTGDLAVGAPLDDDGGGNGGAVWILFLSCSATSATFPGDGINADTITPVDAVIGSSWSAPLTLGHSHGPGGPLSLRVRSSTINGPNFPSPIGGRLTEFLIAGQFLSTIPGTHDGFMGGIAPLSIPDSTSLVGLSWAAQYTVVGGGFADLSQAAIGVVGCR